MTFWVHSLVIVVVFYVIRREILGNSVGKSREEPASVSVAGAGCARSRGRIAQVGDHGAAWQWLGQSSRHRGVLSSRIVHDNMCLWCAHTCSGPWGCSLGGYVVLLCHLLFVWEQRAREKPAAFLWGPGSEGLSLSSSPFFSVTPGR